jgi:biopolymer transport protein ExbD
LIDVCFLLLIYFIVTSTIQPREQDLPMTLPIPVSTNTSLDNYVNIILGIKENGSIVMNEGAAEELLDDDITIREIPQTKERLKLLNDLAMSNDSKVFVQLIIDEGVSHQRFIDVINCLRGEGLNQVAIGNYDDKPL